MLGAALGSYSALALDGRAQAAGGSFRPLVAATIIPIDCGGGSYSVDSTFSKLEDLGDFVLNSADSGVEMTFEGRIQVGSLSGSSAIFEVRIDDTSAPQNCFTTRVQDSEIGFTGHPVAFSPVFENLSAGQHTLSLWARANFNNAYSIALDPGCYGSDKVLILEHLPFGSTYLPSLIRE